MDSSNLPRMAPIQRLPFELRAQVARELCDFDLYDQRNYQIDPSGDTFFNGHTYEWKPLQKASGKPQLSFQPVYDDLRALSLVSKDFRDPAQRALFAVVIVGEPTAYFKLLRTLLESPEVRSYIRCLLAIFVRNPDVEMRRPEIERSRWAAFVHILCPHALFSRFLTHDLQNDFYVHKLRNRLHPRGDAVVLLSDRIASDELESREFGELVTEVLYSVVQLCHSLRAFHLHCSNGSWGQSEDPCTYWTLYGVFSPWTKALQSDPLLTTLTIDVRALEVLHRSTMMINDKCPPSVQHLTVIGSTTGTQETFLRIVNKNIVFQWVSGIARLKTLRFWNGFGNAGFSATYNWNDFLLKFKSTLEQLIVGGTRTLLHLCPDDILGRWAFAQQSMFGPSLMLSCLSEMQKLRYLSVPIQYLRRCPEDMEPLEILVMPDEVQDVRQVVEADVKFPKSLERAEILMVQEVEDNLITEVKALRIDLGKNGHTTRQIV